MEINERFLTLLTPEGEFLRARKQDRVYVIGQEIDFFPLEQENGKKSSSLPIFNVLRGKAIFAAAFALLLAVVSFLPFYQSEEVYAYMSIDVNPSIELGVNEKHQVIELVPYNEDGKLIVEKIKKWKKENIQAVAEKILHQLKEQGYLKENNEMVIAAVYADEENKEDDVFQAELTEIKEAAQKEQLEVTLIEASEEDREKAVEKGITTGLYKENQLKANRKSSEKEKASSENATVEKEVSQEKDKKSAETPPGQFKKQEKPVPAAANMDKPKTQIEKTPAPGQTKKIEQQKANQNPSDKSNGNNNTQNNKGNSDKENNEKKNESNTHSKNNKVQLSNKNNSESKGNGKKPESSAKNKEKNNKQ